MHKEEPAENTHEELLVVNYLARYVHVRLDILGSFSKKFTFTNTGKTTIQNKDWQIYFFHLNLITNVDNIPLNNSISLSKCGVRITHVNGDLYCMQPTASFKTWLPKGKIELTIQAYSSIARTDVMPNWYVVYGNVARILNCTKDEALTFVEPFDSTNRWKIHPDDIYNPYTPEQRYSLNKVEDLRKVVRPVMPTPVELTISDASTLTIDPQTWVIISEQGMEQEAAYLSGKKASQMFHISS